MIFLFGKDSRFSRRIIHKKSVFVVQVSIKKHGLKTLYLLFKVQESFFEVLFPSDQASPVAYSIVVLHYTHHIKSMVGQRGEGCQKAQKQFMSA